MRHGTSFHHRLSTHHASAPPHSAVADLEVVRRPYTLMPKHAFKFPPVVVNAVRRHVQSAIEAVDPRRYNQESPYTAALANRLEGIAYEGPHGSVEFYLTIVDDRGSSSAESVYGADLAITATISDGQQIVRKAILIQAKRGEISNLNRSDEADLVEQIIKMKKLVAAPKVMQIPESEGRRFPQIISGNNILQGISYTPMDLDSYFVARVTTTLDGCTNDAVIAQVQDSGLTQIVVNAKLNRDAFQIRGKGSV